MTRTRKANLDPQWERVRSLFEKASPLDAAGRAELLRNECGGDSGLFDEVQSLLLAEDIGSALEHDPSMPSHVDGVPRTLGRYEVIERLGVGGMGTVFRGRLVGAGKFTKDVALKLVQVQTGHGTGSIAKQQLFEFEARLSSRLHHPNIVEVYDFSRHNDTFFIAMEYVPGRDLADVLALARERGRMLPVPLCVFITHQVAVALAYASKVTDPKTGEELNIVHRDIAPKNIMLSTEGAVKVIDFGIAIAKDRQRFTNAGQIRGSLPYISPEHASGHQLDARSDLFSLGATLYEMITGYPLFQDQRPSVMLKQIRYGTRAKEALEQLRAPADVLRVLERLLARDPNDRLQSAQELVEALRGLASFPREHKGVELVERSVRQLISGEVGGSGINRTGDEYWSFAGEGAIRGRRFRRLRRWGALALTAIVTGVATWYLNGHHRAKTVAATRATTSVTAGDIEKGCSCTVETAPVGAEIRLDGRLVGTTPSKVRLPCGKRVVVQLRSAGRRPVEQAMTANRAGHRMFFSLDSLQ